MLELLLQCNPTVLRLSSFMFDTAGGTLGLVVPLASIL